MRVRVGLPDALRHCAWLFPLLASCGDGSSAPTILWESGRIAYSTEDGSFILARSGGDPVPLTAAGFQFIQSPNISPDGLRVAFTGIEDGAQDYRIYVASLGDAGIEGAPGAVLGFEGAYLSEARWSPDGLLLAATRAGPGLEVWVVGADGSSPRRVAESALQPDWSPDGQFIAFARPAGGPFRIAAVPVGGGAMRELSSTSCGTGCYSEWLPRWQPDGRLSVVHTTEDALDLVLTMDALGGSLDTAFVTTGQQTTYAITWSPDGHLLAISRRTDPTNYTAQVDLYVVDPVAGTEARLTTTSGLSEIVHDWR
jgi:Tol biopolymer transport system component